MDKTASIVIIADDELEACLERSVAEQFGLISELGRMVLSYPQLPLDVLRGNPLRTKHVCRTFSDCTTGPRNARGIGSAGATFAYTAPNRAPFCRCRTQPAAYQCWSRVSAFPSSSRSS